jgi:hypothetical protein
MLVMGRRGPCSTSANVTDVCHHYPPARDFFQGFFRPPGRGASGLSVPIFTVEGRIVASVLDSG